MNTVWSAPYALWTPLQSLLRWLAPAPTSAATALRPAPQLGALRLPTDNSRSCMVPTRRPLRVVRVMEAGQPRSQVGRMVISGRMADVCAELDRLAACEAARS